MSVCFVFKLPNTPNIARDWLKYCLWYPVIWLKEYYLLWILLTKISLNSTKHTISYPFKLLSFHPSFPVRQLHLLFLIFFILSNFSFDFLLKLFFFQYFNHFGNCLIELAKSASFFFNICILNLSVWLRTGPLHSLSVDLPRGNVTKVTFTCCKSQLKGSKCEEVSCL